MKFVVKKLRPAEEDALEAALWYGERESGLGDDFLDELDLAVEALSRDALIHRVRFADVRRAPIRRFKFYGLYYLVREPEVWSMAADIRATCNNDAGRPVTELSGSPKPRRRRAESRPPADSFLLHGQEHARAEGLPHGESRRAGGRVK